MNDDPRLRLLYHFCRLQRPTIRLEWDALVRHFRRAFDLLRAKLPQSSPEQFFSNLFPLDWYVASACLDGQASAWEFLFATRASRSDCLLVDALRARAVRLYPRNDERQESAVTEFWSHLLVANSATSLPVLARYDGQRPLVPWLIRVFQNWHISQLRQHSGLQPLVDDELPMPEPMDGEARWHEVFRQAAHEHLQELTQNELLLLGLRLRYRLSQREVAQLLGVHEGNISRQITKLRDRCLDFIGQRLRGEGWIGDDLSAYVLNEMGGVLMDEPRLGADSLARLLASRGKQLPATST